MSFNRFFPRAAVALLAMGIALTTQADPANKDAVAAATSIEIAFVGPSCTNSFLCTDNEEHVLLSDHIHAKNNGDYMIGVTMECFTGSYDLDSNVPWGFGIDYRRAFVQVWIEIDGAPVYDNAGKVIFCGDETFQLYVDPSAVVVDSVFFNLDFQLNRFGGAHAFNWPVLNLPHGEHLIEVVGRLQARVLGLDDIPDEGTIAGIGKRSLFIQPIHVANGETLDCDGLGCY